MSFRNQAFTAVRWTTAGAIFKTTLQIIQISVLARILAPEDYGLMAMVLVVISFATLFSDFGVNSAFVQQRNVTDSQRSSLFWFNLLVSVALMLAVSLISPLLARFFGDERLKTLIVLGTSNFLIAALGIQIRMAAEKKLMFRAVTMIEVLASIIGFIVALSLAWKGFGVYALLAGTITSTAISVIFFWLFLAQDWRPSFHMDLTEIKSFLSYGGALVGTNLVSQVNVSVDLMFGGRMLVATQLGIYTVPRELMLRVQAVVNPIVTRVAFPLIAEVQGDIERVRLIFLQTLNMTSSTNAIVYILVAFFSADIVFLLLGRGWEGSVEILQILAIWGGLRSTGNPVGSLLLGMGRANLSLKWNLGALLFVMPSIWIGSLYGATGIALALLTIQVLLFVPAWHVMVRPVCEAKLAEYSIVALRPFLLATCAAIPAWWTSLSIDASALRIFCAVVIALPIYIALSFLFNRSWCDAIYELISSRFSNG